jgi:hypothetical protein
MHMALNEMVGHSALSVEAFSDSVCHATRTKIASAVAHQQSLRSTGDAIKDHVGALLVLHTYLIS